MEQFKGVQKKSTAPRHGFGQKADQEAEAGRSPNDRQLNISYGVITEVNYEINKIRVKVFNILNRSEDVEIGAQGPGEPGVYVSIIQPLSVIHHLFGSLRKGLCVRVYWHGKSTPETDSVVEVVSDEIPEMFKDAKKEQELNDKEIGPYLIFSGGLGI